MEILTQNAAEECVITLAGNMLDQHDIAELQQALECCLDQGQRVFRLDMANVGTVEATGIKAFVSALDKVRERNASISLAAVPEHLEDLIAAVNAVRRFGEAVTAFIDTDDTVTAPDALSTVQPAQLSGDTVSCTSSTTIEITSTDAQIAEGARKLEAFLEQLDVDSCTAFAVRVAFTEAVGNAVRHGNKADPSKCVVARCSANDKLIKLSISDEGCGFDCAGAMQSLVDPVRDRSRGLHLMNSLMDEVSYNEAGNVVSMIKSRTVAPPEEHGGNKHGEIVEQACEVAV